MQRLTLLLAALAAFTCSLNAGTKPNIIVILADDMGFSDIGSYGGEIQTPNLDRLADDGIRFKRFYNSGRCCPTRASLMTGLHPHETGIGWMTNPPDSKKMDHGVDFPNYRGFLNKQCVTLAEALKPAGYATLMAGKWHLGMSQKDMWPLQRGFEKFYGCLSGATEFFNPEQPRGITFGNQPIDKPESTTDRRYYTTDAFTDYAIRFIKEEQSGKDRPFFLYLAYTSPHWPLHAHQEEVQKYVGKYMKGWDALREERLERQVKIGLIDEKWQLSDRAHVAWDSLNAKKKKDMDMRMAYYAAMIDRMDQNIGNLVKHLKNTGELDNTLILFMSDNGACQEGGNLGGKGDPFDVETWEDTYGSGASYGMVWANASNTPFRMFKHFTHEGGLSTPLIMHWPEQVKKTGGWYKEPAYLVDIMPTLLDVSGAKYPGKFSGNKIKRLSGVSLKPALTGKSLKRKSPLFFEHEDNAAIMLDNWKLVGSKVSIPGGPDSSKWELYNLSEDRTETRDLSAEMPELRERLANQWLEWANKVSVYPKPDKRTND